MTTALLLKGPLKQPWLNAAVNIIMLAFSILTLYALLLTSIDDIGKLTHYQISEFTINYQGGFVRRGLLGEILLRFCTYTGCSPIPIIFTLCWGCFIFVTVFLLYVFYKHRICWWIIPTSYIIGASYINLIRKDFIVISLFILALYLYRNARWSATSRLFCLCVITALTILIYEGLAFLILPIVAWIAFADDTIRVNLWLRSASLYIPLVAMAACSVYTGDAVTAQAIHASWQPWTGEIVGPYMSQSLLALRWSIYDSLTTNQSILLAACAHQPTTTIVYRIIIWVILLYMGTRYISSMSLSRRPDLDDDNAHAAALFTFIFICMTPLWLGLSCDFGRLSMQLFAITFISYHYLPLSIVPQRIVDTVTLLNYKIDKLIPPTLFITLLLLFSGISPCLFNIESLWDWSVINSLFEYFHTKWLLFHPQ